jgi:hypothetical protein
MNTTRAKAERWALAILLATQLHTVRSDESRPPPPAGPLPLTCEAPVTKDSGLALRIQLTADAFKTVVFDHPKPQELPAGVLGQTKICACVDNEGNLKNPVKLVRSSGSPQLDAEATEIGKNISYPAGHPGCMHQTVNFTAP